MTEANKPEEVKSKRFRWFTAAIIGLMIVLMVYSGNTMNRQAHMAHGVLFGTSNTGDVMSQDSRYASNLLEALSQVYLMIPQTGSPMPQPMPLLSLCWGEAIIRDLKAHPEALYLALREARRVSPGVNPYSLGSADPEQQQPDAMGIFNNGTVGIDELRPLPTSQLGMLRTRLDRDYPIEMRVVQHLKEGRVTQLSPNSLPPLDQQHLYAALTDFLTLQSAASLPLNAIKPTTPMLDRMLAQRSQSFSLQLAAIDAAPFIAKVQEPTEEQLKTQLATYAAYFPGRFGPDNAFGFGYRVPDRIKLQVISFKRADVRKVVEAEKTPYEWEVAARIAYAKEPSLAGPTSQPTTGPANIPVIPPFEAVKDRVVTATIDRVIDARSAEIEKAIRAPMMLDYQQWSNATTTRPGVTAAPSAVVPKTSFGETYDSITYLQKLGQQVAAKFKVQPIVEDYTDAYRDVVGLHLLRGFNDATRPLPPDLARRIGRTNDLIAGPEYAIIFAKDLLDPLSIETLGALVLERYRPSERLELDRAGIDRETFYFRIADAERTHPGTDIDSIREKLKSDWRVAEAQKLCVAEAQKAVTAIQGGADFAAAVMAIAPATPIVRTDVGPFSSAPPDPIPLGLSMPAYAQLGIRVTDELLGEKTDVAVLDVPLASKAYVAKRLSMRGDWTSNDDLRSLRQQMRARLVIQMAMPRTDANIVGVTEKDPSASWLDSKAILERFAYKPTTDTPSKE